MWAGGVTFCGNDMGAVKYSDVLACLVNGFLPCGHVYCKVSRDAERGSQTRRTWQTLLHQRPISEQGRV